jgi:predicted Zn-dependent protease
VAGTAALRHATAGTPFGLLQWARYRLATRFADRDAGVALLAAHSPRGVHVPLAQAAEVGMLLLGARDASGSTKRLLLRRLAALHPKGLRRTPQLLFAQARATAPRQWLHAQALLEQALHQAPNMVDAQLLHAQALLRQPAHLDAPLLLVALCRQGDPDIIEEAAQALLQAGETQHLSEALEPLGDGGRIALAAPQHQDALWSLKVRLHLHRGALAEALAAAKARVALALALALGHETVAVRRATLDYAALLASSGGDASVPLQQALLQVSVPAEQAPYLFVRHRQMLRRGSTAEDQATVQALQALPGNEAQGLASLSQAELQEKLGQVGLAQQSYSRAAAAGQGAAQTALLRLANAAGSPTAARAGLQKLASQRHEPTAFLALAQLYQATGDAARRAAALEAALYYGPAASDPVQVFLDYVDALSSSGQGAQAQALAESFAEAQPADRRAMALAAQVARQAHVPEAAATRLRSWLATHPQDTAAYLALADTQIDMGHADQALQTLAELQQKNVGARSAEYFYLGARATAAADPVKARSLLQASLALQPQAQAYVLLAEMEQTRGKGEEALQAYRQALTLSPQRHEVRLKLAQLLLQRTLVVEAVGELQLLLRDHPDSQAAAELLGDALHEQDQDVKAAAAYAQASFGQHASPTAWLKLSRLQLRQLGQPRAALVTLRHALAAQPNEPEAVYLLALAQRDVGARAAAREAFAHYLRLAPQGEYAVEVREALADLTHN